MALFFSYSYKNQPNKEDVLHAEYQIKTFWLWLLYTIVAAILLKVAHREGALVGIPGIALLIYAFVFHIKRNIKGIMSIKNSVDLDKNFMYIPFTTLKDIDFYKNILSSKKTKAKK